MLLKSACPHITCSGFFCFLCRLFKQWCAHELRDTTTHWHGLFLCIAWPLVCRWAAVSVCPLCSYIRFSTICANAVRAALKPQAKSEAMKAAEATVKVFKPKTACKLTFEYVYYSLFVPNVMYFYVAIIPTEPRRGHMWETFAYPRNHREITQKKRIFFRMSFHELPGNLRGKPILFYLEWI